MIERDISHLRFLHTRVMRGETLSSEDINFVITKKVEIAAIHIGIDEILDRVREKEAEL